MSKFWNLLPLHTEIVELLIKKQGTYTDDKIFEELKDSHKDLSFTYFNKMLMKLEIDGVIRVLNLTKNKKSVELLKFIPKKNPMP